MSLIYEEKRAGQVKERDGLDFPLHLHQAVEIVWLRQGAATLLLEGEALPLSPGDLALIFPDRIHGYRDSREVDAVVFILPLTVLSPFREILDQREPARPVLRGGQWEDGGLPALMALAAADSGREEEPVMNGYFRAVAGKVLARTALVPAGRRAGDLMRDAIRLIHKDPAASLTRRDLARALGVSESTLSHQFSRALGVSLPRYVADRRLEEARRLLSETDLTVTRAAEKAGFGSPRSLNRAWHARYGDSPRRKCRLTLDEKGGQRYNKGR